MEDLVNNPSHYVANRRVEPIEIIEDWQLDHHLACALKYISRAGRKVNGPGSGLRPDLEKAIWYLRRRIELETEMTRDSGAQST